MFRAMRGWINQVATLGIDPDRLETAKQAELAHSMAQLESARTAQQQQQQVIRQACQVLEQQLLERLQANQMCDQWELLQTQLHRQTQKAQLTTKITTAEDFLQTAHKLNRALPKAQRMDEANAQLAATIVTDQAALAELTQQHQAVAQEINRRWQNVADPQLQPLWISCCQERDRLGKAGGMDYLAN